MHDVVVAPFSVRMLGGAVGLLGVVIVVGNIVVGFDALVVVVGAVGIAAGLSVLAARVSTRVERGIVTVWFVPWLRVRVPVSEVRAVSIERVDPRRYGGVGIARHGGGRVLCVSAGRGVRFSCRLGTILVQCQTPEEVAGALMHDEPLTT
ncbi:hypothetical protein SAMN05216329_3558 [Curtobacterium sp. YR515]|nr:hypothetical protein SAMN05216329_3558 [Curtobacterium sp. YR515]